MNNRVQDSKEKLDLESIIRQDLEDARRNKDKKLLLVLSSLLADIQNARIAKGNDSPLSEDEVINLINHARKQRLESEEQYRKVDSTDRADIEGWEASVISGYLPKTADHDDMTNAIDSVIASYEEAPAMKQMGEIIKAVKITLASSGLLVDGKALANEVRARLSNK